MSVLYASAFVGRPFGLDGRPAILNSTMVPVLSGYFDHGRADSLRPGIHRSGGPLGARVAVVNDRLAAGFGAPHDAAPCAS